MLLLGVLITLITLDAVAVTALLWGYGRGQDRRSNRLRGIVQNPRLVRCVRTEGPDDEGYSRMVVEYLDGKRALLADHFELASAHLRLRGAGIDVSPSERWLAPTSPALPEAQAARQVPALLHPLRGLHWRSTR
jgi:hypothetical protein